MREIAGIALLLCSVSSAAYGQTAALRIEVRHDGRPVPEAAVVVNGVTYTTDAHGIVVASLPPGTADIVVVKEGFAPATASVPLRAGREQPVIVDLVPVPALEEQVTVSATRTDRRLEDEPMRVEVLRREEIEEKMLMTPGDIVMMLNEMGGTRVQVTSPSLGAASVRIQGLRGRYTRFFADGLPLFGEVRGLGLLQIPPMDLGRVEVIKGVASSLYGAGAMGGVVNLISRRPGRAPQRELLVNRTTRGGTDVVGWYATPARPGWAWTLLAGGHWQERTDVNDDTWSDLPGYARAVVRPRVFWDGGDGRTVFATAGFTAEAREGGGRPGGEPYREALRTRGVDAGAVGQLLIRQRYLLSVRAAAVQQRHDHRFGEIRERDGHGAVFAEVTVRLPARRHALVAGLAVEHQTYRPTDVSRFAYTFTSAGVFVQDDVDFTRWCSVSASVRLDHHSAYGTFVSPRVSALVRAGRWTSRLSLGTGFVGPTPLTEETEAAGLARLVVPEPLRAEEGRSVSLDVGRTDGPLSYTVSLFGSRIQHPIKVDRSGGLVLRNLGEPSTHTGLELLGTLRREPYAVTATYTYVRSREFDAGARRQAPLTPRHSAGIVATWERAEAGRVGVEFFYTGVQRLEENPFRETSRPYAVIGVLAERRFGRVRVFVNGENLTDVRQTRWDPLIRPARAPDGRWTVDAWAPLEGRTVNGGVRLQF